MRVCVFIILFFAAGIVHPQQYKPIPETFVFYLTKMQNTDMPSKEKTMPGGSITLNYFQTDQNIFNNNSGAFISYPLLFNANNTQDSIVTQVWLGIDTIVSTNGNYTFAIHNMQNTMLDSITIICGHENNSGTNDTLVVAITKADSNAFPLPNILWSDTIIANQSFNNSTQFNNFQPLTIPVQFLLPDTMPFSIHVQYFGTLTDSFAIQTGFGAFSTCASTGLDKAEFSNFYPNSFAYWTGYNLLLPTQSGGDLFVNCDGQPGFDTLIDGANPIQNLNISLHLSSPLFATHTLENKHIQLYPNPAHNYIVYTLKALPSKMAIYSILGENITTLHQPGLHGNIAITHLKHGIYFVKFIIEGRPYVRKFIKQ